MVNNSIPHKFGIKYDESKLITALNALAESERISYIDIASTIIKDLIDKKKAVGKVLSLCIDMCSDQFISNEFYKKYPDILLFLARAGSTDDELRFRAYMHTHPEIFRCKKCSSPLLGGCPIIKCSNLDCEKEYYIEIEDISKAMCENCVAFKLDTCTIADRDRKFKILAI